jgi:hypothetical protein
LAVDDMKKKEAFWEYERKRWKFEDEQAQRADDAARKERDALLQEVVALRDELKSLQVKEGKKKEDEGAPREGEGVSNKRIRWPWSGPKKAKPTPDVELQVILPAEEQKKMEAHWAFEVRRWEHEDRREARKNEIEKNEEAQRSTLAKLIVSFTSMAQITGLFTYIASTLDSCDDFDARGIAYLTTGFFGVFLILLDLVLVGMCVLKPCFRTASRVEWLHATLLALAGFAFAISSGIVGDKAGEDGGGCKL